MKYFVIIASSLFLLIPTHQLGAVEYARKYVPDFQKIGEGRFSYMLWDLYDASLYAPKAEWKPGDPIILTLSYLRDLKGDKIAETAINQIKRQNYKNEQKLNLWHQKMRSIFPDVTDQDVITGIYTPQKETIFYKNGQSIGRIADPEFGEMFFNIWIGEQTMAPNLRAQLLGIN